MTGNTLQNILKNNDLNKTTAALYFGVSRQTIQRETGKGDEEISPIVSDQAYKYVRMRLELASSMNEVFNQMYYDLYIKGKEKVK